MTNKLIHTENRLVAAEEGGMGIGKMREGRQKIQTSSYKIKKSWGYNINNIINNSNNYSHQYCIAHLKVAKRVNPKSPHHKKKIL